MSSKLARAEARYRLWHQKHPKGVIQTRFSFPEQVKGIGQAVHILYHSDKWEEDGNGYDYSHDFDSLPSVYTADGEGRAKSVKRLLKCRDLNEEIALPILAHVKELTIRPTGAATGAQDQLIKFTSHAPLMCCTTDLKTLVIFTADEVLFINGGKMVITERGIVK